MGHIRYQNSFSMEAELCMGDINWKVIPVGFWQNVIQLKNNENTVMDLKSGWKELIITVYSENSKLLYFLNYKTICGSVFELLDQNRKE